MELSYSSKIKSQPLDSSTSVLAQFLKDREEQKKDELKRKVPSEGLTSQAIKLLLKHKAQDNKSRTFTYID